MHDLQLLKIKTGEKRFWLEEKNKLMIYVKFPRNVCALLLPLSTGVCIAELRSPSFILEENGAF